MVVFHYPRDPEKSYIKRVIALPGDRIRIDHGQVYVNGKPCAKPMSPRNIATRAPWPRWSFPTTATS